MEHQQSKVARKRVANFTADEKALLAQLIKKMPIVESKLTDGKSISKKQAAWDLITLEFNCNANVHKRETITLKRAWDNMKAYTRKVRATERGNLLRTGGGPQAPPPPPQQGAIITMVEEAAPTMICEIKNMFDSDGTILNTFDSSLELDSQNYNKNKPVTSVNLNDTLDTSILNVGEEIDDGDNNITFDIEGCELENMDVKDTQNSADYSAKSSAVKVTESVRKPTDYVRREGVLRIKMLEHKKAMEAQIYKTQLQVEQIKKRAAILEEERQKTLLEKARMELEELKKLINKQNHPN